MNEVNIVASNLLDKLSLSLSLIDTMYVIIVPIKDKHIHIIRYEIFNLT